MQTGHGRRSTPGFALLLSLALGLALGSAAAHAAAPEVDEIQAPRTTSQDSAGSLES